MPQRRLKEIDMINKTKTALIAAFIVGSASAAFAQEELTGSAYLLTPNAPFPYYYSADPFYAGGAYSSAPYGAVSYAPQWAPAPTQRLIEGRNVAVGVDQFAFAGPSGPYAFVDSGQYAFEHRLDPKH
jgi:hypothetical protein